MTTFEPPGPGGWKRLADHFPGALTPEYQLLYTETAPPAMALYMARYGVLARTLDIAYVHGHLYIAPVPLAGRREMRRPPPATAVWLLSRLHPEFRRRTAAARRALADRPWRAAAERWFASERAEWHRRDQGMQDIDPAQLDDDSLSHHLADSRALVVDGYRRHFELHGDDLLPLGLLLVRATEWGLDPATVLRALDGASPVSTGTVTPPAWQLVTGYDLDNLSWCELQGRVAGTGDARPHATIDLQPLVAPEHRAELDRLVADARAAVPLRDDNGALTGAWPMGLLRRAMLEAGHRIDLQQTDHAVELTVGELRRRLAGAAAPSADDAAERAATRRRDSALDAPATLGPDFAIPPLSALPRPLALIGAAQLASADHMLGNGTTAVGIGTAPYTGRALVVDDPNAALDEIEPGDIVITRATSPSWNVVLVHAGALVTTTGGLLSHAAVIARELAIPAVIGDRSAHQRFTTGMAVTVDPLPATVTAADRDPTRASAS